MTGWVSTGLEGRSPWQKTLNSVCQPTKARVGDAAGNPNQSGGICQLSPKRPWHAPGVRHGLEPPSGVATMPIIYYLCIAAAGRVGYARGAKWLIISYLHENGYPFLTTRFCINH